MLSDIFGIILRYLIFDDIADEILMVVVFTITHFPQRLMLSGRLFRSCRQDLSYNHILFKSIIIVLTAPINLIISCQTTGRARIVVQNTSTVLRLSERRGSWQMFSHIALNSAHAENQFQ